MHRLDIAIATQENYFIKNVPILYQPMQVQRVDSNIDTTYLLLQKVLEFYFFILN